MSLPHQDWNEVVIRGGKSNANSNRNQNPVTNRENVTTTRVTKKNNQKNSDYVRRADGDDVQAPPTISFTLSSEIRQARQQKNWTQKELAQRISERVDVVASYENGKAIPNQQIIGKLKRALGVQFSVGK